MKRAMPWWVPLILLLLLLWTIAANAKQTQPDPNRVKQIQTALLAHGFESGKTWPQTQEILRGIAKAHGWQVHRAPDARVLGCVLELGNKYFDPQICDEGPNRLEKPLDDEAQ
jgi:hypothetical protein